jgi:hypothetical protein
MPIRGGQWQISKLQAGEEARKFVGCGVLGTSGMASQTPEALGALVKADAEKWWPMIKEFGIKAE